MVFSTSKAKNLLAHNNYFFVIIASIAAFVCYTCMYGFRKPFTVATFDSITFLGINYKVCLVIAQVLGYMLSKLIGIRFISSLGPNKRAQKILLCIFIAWFSLLLFAITPAPYNLIFIFINGLPLGLLFGLVFSFLEGRNTTEILGAFLVSSFIFASGFAKTVGKFVLLNLHVSDNWMPFVAGAFYIIPLLISVYLLQLLPSPNTADIDSRMIRSAMDDKERKDFIQLFKWMVIPIVISYTLLTIARDFIEDFANEFWMENGFQNCTTIFASISSIISIVIILVFATFFLIKNNYKALLIMNTIIATGLLLVLFSSVLFAFKILSPFHWMFVATTGLYMSYLPFNGLYFDRFIAVFKIKANVGFVMYLADTFGYLGTVVILIFKSFANVQISWTHFLILLMLVVSFCCFIFISFTYYRIKLNVSNYE